MAGGCGPQALRDKEGKGERVSPRPTAGLRGALGERSEHQPPTKVSRRGGRMDPSTHAAPKPLSTLRARKWDEDDQDRGSSHSE